MSALIRRCLAISAVALLAIAATAMSVLPPSFHELVTEAVAVARVRVIDVSSRVVAAANGERQIRTFVTFSTIKALKGAPGATFTLSFLGGSVAGEDWTVPGMPQFKVGAEDYVFATGEDSVCPLVGAMHGRYRVEHDPQTAQAYVGREDGIPLTSTAEIGAPLREGAAALSIAPVDRLTPDQFERQIAAELAASQSPNARQ